MAEELRDYLIETEADVVEPNSVRNQYKSLREQLIHLDEGADNHLPYVRPGGGGSNREEDVEELAVGFGQMVAYLRSVLEVAGERSDISSVAAPIVDLLTILQSRGLGVRWAISAAALSMVEVITNQTLAKLAIDEKGDFDTRLNKVASALKTKGIEIPALLSSGLYKVRSKVIHEGKEPTKEEVQTIFAILNSLHQKTQ